MSSDVPTKSPAGEMHLKQVTMHWELRRHALTERQRLIATVLVELSYGCGVASVVVPSLQQFTDLTGIARPHVHEAITGLLRMRVVRTEAVSGGTRYVIEPNSDAWKVEPRVAPATINRAFELIQHVNHHPILVSPYPAGGGELPNFREAHHAEFLFTGVTDLGTQLKEEGEGI